MSSIDNRSYYDEFAAAYEARRRPNDPHGYHALIDDLEIEIVERYATNESVLECGCGTGLLLERIARFAKRAQGIDLSPGMLDKARERGLDVREASVTAIPFPDASFGVTCSFKVLAHVEDIRRALSEMARVTKPGGIVLAEFYNPYSFRGFMKRAMPAGRVSNKTRESAVYTRFDPPWSIARLAPEGTRLEARYGVRIVTPAAAFMRVPVLRAILPRLERRLAPTPASFLAGFHVVALRTA